MKKGRFIGHVLCAYTINVSKPFNDQSESPLIVTHTTQEKDHLRNKISVATYVICLLKINEYTMLK